MHSHSASERSVGYLFLMRARVANHYPTHPFRTVSEGKFSEVQRYEVAPARPDKTDPASKVYACYSPQLLVLARTPSVTTEFDE